MTYRVVIFPEHNGPESIFIAQGVDYDICSQGSSVAEVRKRISNQIAIMEEMSHRGYRDRIDVAPEQFEALWDQYGEYVTPTKGVFIPDGLFS